MAEEIPPDDEPVMIARLRVRCQTCDRIVLVPRYFVEASMCVECDALLGERRALGDEGP